MTDNEQLGALDHRVDGSEPDFAAARALQQRFAGFLLNYRFAMEEVMTKINILKSEFEYLRDYSPIEHVSSRLKSPDGILAKARRRGTELSDEALRDDMRDIAGIRVVCSFISDAYWVADMLTRQTDITIIEIKDYIAEPKPNGYKSLHLILAVPVFLSGSVETMPVEVQIRTVAMDFWASLEHKIYYKFGRDIPQSLLAELTDAAEVANRLDVTMERTHNDVRTLDDPSRAAQ